MPIRRETARGFDAYEEHMRIPHRFSPIVFGFLLSGFMSLIVAGIATLRTLGLHPEFAGHWANAWLPAWCIAFPVVLFVAPLVRRMAAAICAPPMA